MTDKSESVSRVVRRRPNQGCEQAYEALVRGMLEESSRFPGYLSAAVIPPHLETDNGTYQIVQRFATQADLNRWDSSTERAIWHERIRPFAWQEPAYHQVSGLEVWFPSPAVCAGPPPKWKMTVVSWLGIFPTAAASLGILDHFLKPWPYLLRMALVTAVVAILMAYAVMPTLSAWMSWWLRRK